MYVLLQNVAAIFIDKVRRKYIFNVDTPTIVLKDKRKCIAVKGIPSHSYGVTLAIWDHTVLPVTRHK